MCWFLGGGTCVPHVRSSWATHFNFRLPDADARSLWPSSASVMFVTNHSSEIDTTPRFTFILRLISWRGDFDGQSVDLSRGRLVYMNQTKTRAFGKRRPKGIVELFTQQQHARSDWIPSKGEKMQRGFDVERF